MHKNFLESAAQLVWHLLYAQLISRRQTGDNENDNFGWAFVLPLLLMLLMLQMLLLEHLPH